MLFGEQSLEFIPICHCNHGNYQERQHYASITNYRPQKVDRVANSEQYGKREEETE